MFPKVGPFWFNLKANATVRPVGQGSVAMARSKYQANKRQKEIAREKKQELKRQQKLEKKKGELEGEETWETVDSEPGQDAPPPEDTASPDSANQDQPEAD